MSSGSLWFKPEEFYCKCGRVQCDASKTVSIQLLDKLDCMRESYGRAISVNSGLRCAYWNRKQGGVPGSEHETGEGADLACSDSNSRWKLITIALAVGFRRIGIGKTFLHVGVSHTHEQDVVWTYYP